MDLSAEHFSLQHPKSPPSSQMFFAHFLSFPDWGLSACTQSHYLSHVQLSSATMNIRSALCLKYEKRELICVTFSFARTSEWLHAESKCKLWKAAPSTSNNLSNDAWKFALFLSNIKFQFQKYMQHNQLVAISLLIFSECVMHSCAYTYTRAPRGCSLNRWVPNWNALSGLVLFERGVPLRGAECAAGKLTCAHHD